MAKKINFNPLSGKFDFTETPTASPVDSVNGQTGVVVLDTDDIDDTASNRYTDDTDIARLANTSGTNTGDQDLSGKQDTLVSGTNIKTINGGSVLGSGDIPIIIPDPAYSQYIYNSSGSQAGNRYNTWTDLYDTIRASNNGSYCQVTIEQNENIAIGTNAVFDGITFAGNGTPAIAGGLMLAITSGNISSFDNLRVVAGLGFVSTSSSPLFSVSSGSPTVYLQENAGMGSFVSEMFNVSGTANLVIIMEGASGVFGAALGAYECCNLVDATADITMLMDGFNAIIDNNIFRGPGKVSIVAANPAISTGLYSKTQANHTGSYKIEKGSHALNIGYDNTDSGLTASDVKAAVDELSDRRTDAPSSSSDTGTAGQIAWDSSYIYVCVATDVWKRTALSSW